VVGKFTPELRDGRLISQQAYHRWKIEAYHRWKIEVATYQWNSQPGTANPRDDAAIRELKLEAGTFSGPPGFKKHDTTAAVFGFKGKEWHVGLDYCVRLRMLQQIERVMEPTARTREQVLASVCGSRSRQHSKWAREVYRQVQGLPDASYLLA